MTYEELCNKNIGDMNKDELFEFSIGLLGEVHDYEKEIVRLNNIIDELEKNLNIPLQTEQAWDEYCYGYNDCLEDMLNKLKELKGSDTGEQ